jgi:hypothetical protein
MVTGKLVKGLRPVVVCSLLKQFLLVMVPLTHNGEHTLHHTYDGGRCILDPR